MLKYGEVDCKKNFKEAIYIDIKDHPEVTRPL